MTRTRHGKWLLLATSLVVACASSASPASPESASVDESRVSSTSTPGVRVALGGDVMFGRWDDGVRRDFDAGDIWEAARDVFARTDVAIINLESAICPDERASAVAGRVPIQLTARPEKLSALAHAGVDVANVANNHATDCGSHSVDETVAALEGAGIDEVGVHGREARTISVESGTIVVVGATIFRPVIAPANEATGPNFVPRRHIGRLVEEVRALRASSPDAWLLVSIHWGRELVPTPGGWQRDTARALVDAGADIIHGHGSHTVQRTESYRGAAIAYGLGNLHFDMRDPSTRDRVVADVTCRRAPERRCQIELVDLR